MIFVGAIVLGLVVLAINARQHLGRTPGARSWARGLTPSTTERKVLVLWPAFGLFLVLAGGLGLAQGTAAAVTLGLLMMATLLLLLAYAVLPLPIPRVVKPRWYAAERPGRRSGRG